MEEINCVRNHISELKGGKLAKYIHPAELINLMALDQITRAPWGPAVPDPTTFNDALQILVKYDLWRTTPESVRRHITRGLRNAKLETLKDKDFKKFKVHNVILADNVTMCEAAERKAAEL